MMNFDKADNPATTIAATAIPSPLFLGKNGEWWDGFLLFSVILAAVAAVAIVASTAGSITAHKREAAAADAERERFKIETAGRVADAKQEGIKAGETAGNALLRAAELETEAANTRERAANIEARIAPRTLSPAVSTKLRLIMQSYPNRRVRVASYALDVESTQFATQVIQSFGNTGTFIIDARLSLSAIGSLAVGVRVSGNDNNLIKSILSCFEISDIFASEEPVPPISGISSSDFMSPVDAEIFVGPKPVK